MTLTKPIYCFVLVVLASALGIAADDPPTSAQLVDDLTEVADCRFVLSLKGKGKTDELAQADLKRKAWWNRADFVHITAKTKKGFMGDAYRCRTVRITSNPEVIRGCKFLENVEIYNSFSAMLGTNDPVKSSDLAAKAWKIGADAIMVIDTDNNSGSAEAYFCADKDTTAEE